VESNFPIYIKTSL